MKTKILMMAASFVFAGGSAFAAGKQEIAPVLDRLEAQYRVTEEAQLSASQWSLVQDHLMAAVNVLKGKPGYRHAECISTIYDFLRKDTADSYAIDLAKASCETIRKNNSDIEYVAYFFKLLEPGMASSYAMKSAVEAANGLNAEGFRCMERILPNLMNNMAGNYAIAKAKNACVN